MLYRATHRTAYYYSEPVSICHNQVHLTPRSCARQRVVETALHVEPRPARITSRTDCFGNIAASFAILEPHDRLVVTADSVVEVLAQAEAEPVPWEAARDRVGDAADDGAFEAMHFVFDSPFARAWPAVRSYAEDSFAAGRPLAEAAACLCGRIHRDFRYDAQATSVTTPVEEVFEQRHGVCQDFAHVAIACLRSLGLAARYVSGYLRSAPGMVGAEASHAWISVYGPGGWIDFDPTNDVAAGLNHVTVAWGRDYGDVAPVRGVALGGGEHTVTVSVGVEPL